MQCINPVTKMDYPDPDVIRVDDVYYMLSSTWHFMPGGAILRSYDLQNWEPVSYLFDELEGTDKERLIGEQCNYGKGMESGRLYYHNGKFYASFFARWYDKLFLYTADDITGPWKAGAIEGGFFDGHLLFDEDKVYVVFGHGKIWITELLPDLSAAKPGGFSRQLIEDTGDVYLPFCSPHIYHINHKYYLFVMNWPQNGTARRTQYCFVADSLQDEFQGSVVFDDTDGFFNEGIAKGGLVDTPSGRWFAILFQHRGAVGRMPYIIPVQFENDFPVFGDHGKVTDDLEISNSRPFYFYQPLYTSDDFKYEKRKGGFYQLKKQWQWNHAPNKEMISFLPEGGMSVKIAKVSTNLIHAQNVLTQRMLAGPSEAQITVDATLLMDGDIAGICALQACYGLVGITKEMGRYYLQVIVRDILDSPMDDTMADYLPGTVVEKIALDKPVVSLKIEADFTNMNDYCEFYYEKAGEWIKIGKKHNLYFKMDHYVGCRYGIFAYATKQIGGIATFMHFVYTEK